jgi:hypothetical protein
MHFRRAMSTARLASISTVVIAASALIGLTSAAQAASHPAPYPKALKGRTYVETFGRTQLYTWRNPKNDPGNCPANPSQVSDHGSAVAVVTTGKNGNCSSIESPHTYPVSSGYVYEAKVYFSAIPGTKQFADWDSFWMYGSNWPSGGELDAVETTFGTQFLSYHYGSSNSEVSTCNKSNGCDTSAGVVKPLSANIKPGWHIVDIAYGSHKIQVFYDGRAYASISGSFVSPQPAWITFSAGSSTTANKTGIRGTIAVKWVRIYK